MMGLLKIRQMALKKAIEKVLEKAEDLVLMWVE